MVERPCGALSVRRQCGLLGINRNRLEAREKALRERDLPLARRIDAIHLDYPEFGTRRMRLWLAREGIRIGRGRVRRIMEAMGLKAVYRRPRTSQPAPGHKVYSYLLRDRKVERPDEAWCADITYIPMERGFAFLVAIMDWRSRAVVGWELSNTMESDFCVRAFWRALTRTAVVPQILNTDQGSQFTSQAWTRALESAGVQISMDGKGRWVDNVFVERLWRSVKHEGVYLWSYESLHDLERALENWFERYNRWKPHSALGGKTPWEVYRPQDSAPWKEAA